MKYVRSTLATTVLAVFGLGVAVQNLHSHDRDAQARPITVAIPVTPVAWVDPPGRRTAETTGTRVAALPAAQPVAVTLPVPAEAIRRNTALHRQKAGERRRVRIAHFRRPAHARTAAVDPAAMAQPTPQAAPDTGGRIDPLGDILRGLGFGHDG
jgi:hypothetical protein